MEAWKPSIQDLKNAWKDKIDVQLNDLCKTDVTETKDWPGWKVYYGDQSKWITKENLSVLSLRLKSVYDDRMARRGWTLGVDYKTLKEELAEIVNAGAPVTVQEPGENASLQQHKFPETAYLLPVRLFSRI